MFKNFPEIKYKREVKFKKIGKNYEYKNLDKNNKEKHKKGNLKYDVIDNYANLKEFNKVFSLKNKDMLLNNFIKEIQKQNIERLYFEVQDNDFNYLYFIVYKNIIPLCKINKKYVFDLKINNIDNLYDFIKSKEKYNLPKQSKINKYKDAEIFYYKNLLNKRKNKNKKTRSNKNILNILKSVNK